MIRRDTEPTLDEDRAGTIAAASGVYGGQLLGGHLPPAAQAVLRQALHDLCYAAIYAYVTIPPAPSADPHRFRNNGFGRPEVDSSLTPGGRA